MRKRRFLEQRIQCYGDRPSSFAQRIVSLAHRLVLRETRQQAGLGPAIELVVDQCDELSIVIGHLNKVSELQLHQA